MRHLAQIDFSTIEGAIGFTGVAGGNFTTIGGLVNTLMYVVGILAGLFLLIYIIYGGFKFLLAKGDPKAVQAAQQILTNAILGFVIIFVSYWIVQLVALVLGLRQVINIFIWR